jgi:hypothetical protein
MLCLIRSKLQDLLIPDTMDIRDQGLILGTLDPDLMLLLQLSGTMLFLIPQDTLIQQVTPLHGHKQQHISDLLSTLDPGLLVRYVARHHIKPLTVFTRWTMRSRVGDHPPNCKL